MIAKATILDLFGHGGAHCSTTAAPRIVALMHALLSSRNQDLSRAAAGAAPNSPFPLPVRRYAWWHQDQAGRFASTGQKGVISPSQPPLLQKQTLFSKDISYVAVREASRSQTFWWCAGYAMFRYSNPNGQAKSTLVSKKKDICKCTDNNK